MFYRVRAANNSYVGTVGLSDSWFFSICDSIEIGRFGPVNATSECKKISFNLCGLKARRVDGGIADGDEWGGFSAGNWTD